MTPAAFSAWIDDMIASKRARSAADCARLLGVSLTSIYAMRKEGVKGAAARRTALACRALLHNMEPYR